MKKAMLCISILTIIFSLSACDDIKMVQNSFQKEKTRNTEQLGDQPMDVFKKGDLKMENGEYNIYASFSNFLAARYHFISVFYFQGVWRRGRSIARKALPRKSLTLSDML